MKNFLILLFVVGMMGCTDNLVTTSMWSKAEELCKSNGGVSHVQSNVEVVHDFNNFYVHCNNKATFTGWYSSKKIKIHGTEL